MRKLAKKEFSQKTRKTTKAAERQTLHDAIIGELPKTAWLHSKSFLENRWEIATEDATKRRNTIYVIRFDTVVAPGMMLSDLACENDLITAKLLAYWTMSPAVGKFSSAASVTLYVRNYIQFVRWRLSQNIGRNADLTPEWIEEFFLSIGNHGIRGLLPLKERAEKIAQSVLNGDLEIATVQRGKKTHLDLDAAAVSVGVPNGRLLTTAARDVFINLGEELGYDIPAYRKTAKRSDELNSENLDQTTDEENEIPTGTRIANFIAFLGPLWKLRDKFSHDAIGFDPFPGDRTANKVAYALSQRGGNRTFTVPPLQACTLIDHSLKWVLDFAPDIRLYVDRIKAELETDLVKQSWYPYALAAKCVNTEFENRPGHGLAGSPWPIHPFYYPGRDYSERYDKSRPPLRVVLFEFLAAACVIVIAAFSARRREEIESLRYDCISYSVDKEPWLETWIEKSVRDLDKIPVPTSVVRATEVLSWLSSLYRNRTQQPWLLGFDDFVSIGPNSNPKPPRFNVYRSLERFARFAELPLLPDGTSWIPKPHQFRRFFAVTYFHRYRFPHLTALSNFYRHYDPDMTRHYITEVARGGFLRLSEEKRVQNRREERLRMQVHEARLADFDTEAEAFRFERFHNVVTGKERISGWGGETIKRRLNELIGEIKSKLDIEPADSLPEPALNELITAFVKVTRLEPNKLGHSYCKCMNEQQDLLSASCLSTCDRVSTERSGLSAPDPTFAADYICSGCAHNVQFAECETYWTELIVYEERQQRCTLGPLLRALSGERLKMAKEHHSRCFAN